ncbi:efflux RND transporter permease subunit, partial [Klebsiella pneumoniae]
AYADGRFRYASGRAGRHRDALTLVAVFVPLAFMTGLTGQFYKQFAMTIAISTVISAFNSLTLSPALAALLLPSATSNRLISCVRPGVLEV